MTSLTRTPGLTLSTPLPSPSQVFSRRCTRRSTTRVMATTTTTVEAAATRRPMAILLVSAESPPHHVALEPQLRPLRLGRAQPACPRQTLRVVTAARCAPAASRQGSRP
jgi:hypothetical protein